MENENLEFEIESTEPTIEELKDIEDYLDNYYD